MIKLLNGVIVDTPTALADEVRVAVPDLNTTARKIYGPLKFRPYIQGDSSPRLPAQGDKAILGVDDENYDEWIVTWHRDDLLPPPYGPPGGGGGAIINGIWRWTTSTTSAASGYVGINTAAWATATAVNISETTEAGTDITNALGLIQPDDEIYLQDQLDSTKWGKYRITGPVVDNGTYRTMPLLLIANGTGGLPANNRDTAVAINHAAAPVDINADATANTLTPGSPASAVVTEPQANFFHFVFGIPQGATGAAGAAGTQGPKGDTGATGAAGPPGPPSYDTAPIGTTLSWTGKTIPDEFVVANGQRLTQSSYPDGYNFAKAEADAGNTLWTYRTSDMTFTVPDLRDRFIFAAGAKVFGAVGGEENHTLVTAEAAQKALASIGAEQAHQHGYQSNPLTDYSGGGNAFMVTAGSGAAFNIYKMNTNLVGAPIASHTHSVPGTDAVNGHNNMPPYVVLAQLVKVKGVSVTSGAIQGPTGAKGDTGYDAGPIGTVLDWSGKSIPAGYVLADGTRYQQTNYPDGYDFAKKEADPPNNNTLWTYRTSPDISFTVPDLRDRFVFSSGTKPFGALSTPGGATYNGEETHTLTSAESGQKAVSTGGRSASHQHATDPYLSDHGTGWAYAQASGAAVIYISNTPVAAETTDHTHGISGSAAVNGHNNMPPYVVLAKIVKIAGVARDATTITGPAGPKGDPGPWRGAWNGATAYAVGDSVAYTYGSPAVTSTYRRKTPGTTAGTPDTDATNWELVASGGSVGAAGGQLYTLVIGDGSSTSFAVTHGLNTPNTTVTVRRNTAPYDEVVADVEHTDANTVTVRTAPTVPAVGEYIVQCAAPGTPGAGLNITMDVWHRVGATGEPAYGAGWYELESGLKFRKLPDGRIVMQGMVGTPGSVAVGSSSTIFTLPTGYRPVGAAKRFVCVGNSGGAWIEISTAGVVTWSGVSGYANNCTYIILDTVEFDTESVSQTASVAAQPIEPWHSVGAAGEPAFQNAWASYGSGHRTLSFRKTPDGRVWIRGFITGGTIGQPCFTLPAGYRPTQTEIQDVQTGGGIGQCYVNTDGTVTVSTGTNSWVTLNHLSFDTDSVTNYATGVIGPPVVTSLPTTGLFDGLEVYYRFLPNTTPASTVPLLWRLRYDGPLAAWLPVGDQRPIWAQYYPGASVGMGAGSWGTYDANDPRINAMPLAGTYECECGVGEVYCANAIAFNIGLAKNGTVWAEGGASSAPAGNYPYCGQVKDVNTFVTTDVLRQFYYLSGTLQNVIMRARYITARPMRIG